MLNTDGSWKADSGVVGCGGVIKNTNGACLGGFSKRLHVVSGFLAELWGVLEGLLFVAVSGHGVVELQLD